ncbi:VOC family protein [Deinococcus sonorensis]|uniref:VOC family protein n=1 Tax=Deinococcus sonorensis TaxID=309891 RepID=UPI003305D290
MTYAAGLPSWTDLTTTAPEPCRAFYSALFGWVYGESASEYGGYAMAFQQGRVAAGLAPRPAGAGVPSVWTVYFASDDLEADAARVQALGGQTVVAPMQVGEQGHMGVFSDPTGAVFGLWQSGAHQGAENRDDQGSVVWVEVHTPDSARAAAFYTALLRADSVPVPGMDYLQLHRNGEGYAGVMGEEGVARPAG